MNKPAISFEHVSKEFRYYGSNRQRMMREVFWRNTGSPLMALKDINLDIEKGEKVGIIGRDGSGRSTLMNLMAKIIKPTEGKVRVRQEATVIFDHRIGFDMGLSGRDNYYLKASLQGWSWSKIKKMEPEILEFADLKDLIDLPVKTWVPGTLTRLGFTILTSEKPELLLFDEIFNVGPQYLPKCVDRLISLVDDEDTTFVMTVGNYNVAKKICQRGIVLDGGEIVFDGPFMDAMQHYRANCKPDPNHNLKIKEAPMPEELIEEDNDFNDYG